MSLTKRTHSAPCSWIALWNEDYFARVQQGGEPCSTRRERVWALNVRSNVLLRTVVEKVFVDKGIGIAEITPEGLKGFVSRHRPDELSKVTEYLGRMPETLRLDFENHWTALERSEAYRTAIRIGTTGCVQDYYDIVHVACFAYLQKLRSHCMIQSMLEAVDTIGIPRFEYYWMLRYGCLENIDALMRIVAPLSYSKWRLFWTDEATFPVSDSPVLSADDVFMIPLSPRMLATADLKKMRPNQRWSVEEGVPNHVLARYARYCIGNTYKEVVAWDRTILESWQQRDDFRKRYMLLKDAKSYNRIIREASGGKVLMINALGKP
jgi:hypothetical protein